MPVFKAKFAPVFQTFGPACVTILDGSPVVIKCLNYASTARREYAAQPKAVQNTTVTVLQHVSKIRC